MINIIYIYPNIKFINKEINICRIIDDKIKETLIIFGKKDNNNLNIYITNTMTGDNILIKQENDVDKVKNFIVSRENEIKSLESLEKIEKYILNEISE
ncbi:Uncharacterised protein [[Clostridium] sordellii]|uniref:Uncharacterized protein n=1 Tax=Paraclostridium sordellii TaxID=1505 RepID=A0A9P1L257_PARSO|nr:hypothetical protein [Paeniclostridium sordellii]MDU4415118.1 hypothetical protein [Paeniclostridium sordellii]MRZ29484.1 hypothetical protein [Paeniclostridium sordellii]MVO75492.1 hypothetical protein [Paeniclostridium sordellii]CEN85729.1 Uncharacterised protein [[Clostridium] sordellii] [Paeniclostridium sordellii]CEO35870.1 Uncharacterised protein [[Clostridium] sordellii] [Paeniclostridium sordellii]